MKRSFEIKESFPVKPAVLYQSWLSSTEHSKMTGGDATCSDIEGESFSTWDGYISGKNSSLSKNESIVQKWRTTEFAARDKDSEITIHLKETPTGCDLTLIHKDIPEGQPDYKQGWVDHYFTPMKEYFKNKK